MEKHRATTKRFEANEGSKLFLLRSLFAWIGEHATPNEMAAFNRLWTNSPLWPIDDGYVRKMFHRLPNNIQDRLLELGLGI